MGYLNLVGSFVYKEPLFRSKLDALAENDAQLKTDGWGQSTKTTFFQATVPTGWTQDTSQNDKALRVVGSTGGGVSGGGAQALSSAVSLVHSHGGIISDGGHTHTYTDHTHQTGSQSFPYSPVGDVVTDSPVVSDVIITAGLTGGSTSGNVYGDGGTASSGALTLGTTGTHDHGGSTGSSLTSFTFAYCDVILGAKNAPAGTYTDLTTFWHTGDKVDFDPFQAQAFNDAYNLGNLMPAGSMVLWGQQSAPTGWTKTASINDRMLRVVSGAGGGVGGVNLISSGVSLAHTHSVTAVADHVHTVPNHIHSLSVVGTSTTLNPGAGHSILESLAGTLLAIDSGSLPNITQTCYKNKTTSSGGGNTELAGGHTHNIDSSLADFQLAYVDIIQCSKDSSGAPWAYTDYTAEFAWKKLVTYQRLNTLAKNDAYIEYHTTPTASQAFFYMGSAPTGWVKNTSQHDKALRMVSGGTGGTAGGGAQLISQTIPLAHTHTIDAAGDHSHVLLHTHPMDSVSHTAFARTNNYVLSQRSFNQFRALYSTFAGGSGGFGSAISFEKTTGVPDVPTAVAGSHNHGGTTDSQLADIQLAYADVIWCTKS